MKKMKLFAVALACLPIFPLTSMADDYPIPVEQLPAAAKAFVVNHFPGRTIVYAERDFEDHGLVYEAYLNDGTKVEFTSNGNLRKLDFHFVTMPQAPAPVHIGHYVDRSFGGVVVTKMDRDDDDYEIELSDDLELKFNNAGFFISLDD